MNEKKNFSSYRLENKKKREKFNRVGDFVVILFDGFS